MFPVWFPCWGARGSRGVESDVDADSDVVPHVPARVSHVPTHSSLMDLSMFWKILPREFFFVFVSLFVLIILLTVIFMQEKRS